MPSPFKLIAHTTDGRTTETHLTLEQALALSAGQPIAYVAHDLGIRIENGEIIEIESAYPDAA